MENMLEHSLLCWSNVLLKAQSKTEYYRTKTYRQVCFIRGGRKSAH